MYIMKHVTVGTLITGRMIPPRNHPIDSNRQCKSSRNLIKSERRVFGLAFIG